MIHTIKLPPRQRHAARFVSAARRALQRTFVEEHDSRGLTEEELARRLGVDVSEVLAVLRGESNLTLRMLAEYAWAMDRPVKISLE